MGVMMGTPVYMSPEQEGKELDGVPISTIGRRFVRTDYRTIAV